MPCKLLNFVLLPRWSADSGTSGIFSCFLFSSWLYVFLCFSSHCFFLKIDLFPSASCRSTDTYSFWTFRFLIFLNYFGIFSSFYVKPFTSPISSSADPSFLYPAAKYWLFVTDKLQAPLSEFKFSLAWRHLCNCVSLLFWGAKKKPQTISTLPSQAPCSCVCRHQKS